MAPKTQVTMWHMSMLHLSASSCITVCLCLAHCRAGPHACCQYPCQYPRAGSSGRAATAPQRRPLQYLPSQQQPATAAAAAVGIVARMPLWRRCRLPRAAGFGASSRLGEAGRGKRAGHCCCCCGSYGCGCRCGAAAACPASDLIPPSMPSLFGALKFWPHRTSAALPCRRC